MILFLRGLLKIVCTKFVEFLLQKQITSFVKINEEYLIETN